MYGRPGEATIAWLETKFAKKPAIMAANVVAFKAGYNFGDTAEIAATPIEVGPAPLDAGEYRNINGANAMAMGLIAASVKSGLQLFFATYPITPASELLHYLARHNRFGVRTVQAEDEIAAAIRNRGLPVAIAHLRQVEPMPANTGEVVRSFAKVLIPELNTGQLLSLVRDKYLVDAVGYNKVEGQPILAEELERAILELIGNE